MTESLYGKQLLIFYLVFHTYSIANKRHEVFKYKQDDGSFKIPLH